MHWSDRCCLLIAFQVLFSVWVNCIPTCLTCHHKQTKGCKLPPKFVPEAGGASHGAQEGGDGCGEADGSQAVVTGLVRVQDSECPVRKNRAQAASLPTFWIQVFCLLCAIC